MAHAQTKEPPRLTAAAASRLVLIGRPPRLAGLLPLANPGSGKLKLKAAELRLKDSAWGDPHVALRLQVSARVHAGTAVQVPVHLAVDARMPPGDYAAEAHFEGVDAAPREAVLRVLEHRRVAVLPDVFELHGGPGAEVAIPALIGNLGNVPFTPPRVALVALGEDAAVTQLFHVAMARKGNEGHRAVLDAYAQLVGATEVEAAKVTLAGSGEPIAPGENRETTLVFHLPPRLARHRRYHGRFSIGNATCRVDLVVDEAACPAPPTTHRAA